MEVESCDGTKGTHSKILKCLKVLIDSRQEAGKAFDDAARLTEVHFRELHEAIILYDQAAKCYIKINYKNALICYHKIIDLLLGQFFDIRNRDEFYNKGDELRMEHKISHVCVITKFDVCEYENDMKKAKAVRAKLCAGTASEPINSLICLYEIINQPKKQKRKLDN
ncbi:hypothetical protein RF11_07419 [Thelohanellus kitauei]|uniref:Uncharacterized protein n=1 Tax=Thelohanellus kitauei TaxID=669202 RepID=A0A0C2NLJ1_THEKT|nr:hypothetical protein RF11_07419 [Thelohanellus kitauei]